MANNTGKRPFGRNLSDFTDANGNGLRHAERWLLHCAGTGKAYWAGRKRPGKSTKRNTIRPGFLRFLALGGDDPAPVRENGVQLVGAYIDGALDLNHCNVPVPLFLNNCNIDAPIELLNATTQSINFDGSLIKGLHGDGLTTYGDVFLREGFSAKGEVRLVGAKIGGKLSFRNGTLENPKGTALAADRVKTTGNLWLNHSFHATGKIRLGSANIGGNLSCRHGTLENPNGEALAADGVKTTGNLLLEDGFHATGEVRLSTANIGGNLFCRNGTFQNPHGNALTADRVKTHGNLLLEDGFHATGAVQLRNANVGGNLSCDRGVFVHITSSEKYENRCAPALDLQNGVVHGTCFLEPEEIAGSVDLRFAHVAVLADDLQRLPPTSCTTDEGAELGCRVFLDGFIYDRIGYRSSTDAQARQRWLERQPEEDLTTDFKPQPYEQLASVLRTMGHERKAEKIEEAKNDAWALAQNRNLSSWRYFVVNIGRNTWKWLKSLNIDMVIGHDPRVHKAVIIAIFLWIGSSFIFYEAAEQGVMVPSDPRVFLSEKLQEPCAGRNWTTCDAPRMHKEHTTLQPALYALDVILPFAPLGQESAWQPSVDKDFQLDFCVWPTVCAWLPMVVMWMNVIYGWIVGLLIAAVVSGVVKRE